MLLPFPRPLAAEIAPRRPPGLKVVRLGASLSFDADRGVQWRNHGCVRSIICVGGVHAFTVLGSAGVFAYTEPRDRLSRWIGQASNRCVVPLGLIASGSVMEAREDILRVVVRGEKSIWRKRGQEGERQVAASCLPPKQKGDRMWRRTVWCGMVEGSFEAQTTECRLR